MYSGPPRRGLPPPCLGDFAAFAHPPRGSTNVRHGSFPACQHVALPSRRSAGSLPRRPRWNRSRALPRAWRQRRSRPGSAYGKRVASILPVDFTNVSLNSCVAKYPRTAQKPQRRTRPSAGLPNENDSRRQQNGANAIGKKNRTPRTDT